MTQSSRSSKAPAIARLAVLALVAASLAAAAAAGSARAAEAPYTVRMQPLPGASGAGILMDYIAFDPATRWVWAPAGNRGLVAVIDTAGGTVRQIDGFPTAEMGTGERKRKGGPSSVTVGEGSVSVGNRGDSTAGAFNPRSLARGACHSLD